MAAWDPFIFFMDLLGVHRDLKGHVYKGACDLRQDVRTDSSSSLINGLLYKQVTLPPYFCCLKERTSNLYIIGLF